MEVLVKMKITIIVLVVLIPLFSFSQEDIHTLENIVLTEAIEEISKNYKVDFSYNPEILPTNKIASIQIGGKSLEIVLNQLLNPYRLKYKIENNTVIIYAEQRKVTKTYRFIKGRVIDKNTKEPIPGVNVFISNTFNGASTDVNGEFHFQALVEDNFELVASHISYHPYIFYLKSISNLNKIEIELKENVSELNEVVINFSNKEWEDQLKIFKREFIGTTRNSAKCEILNPEVINFDFDEEKNILTASANELIIVENESLGYKVSHLLVLFEYKNDQVKYVTKPKYDYLEHKNRIQERRWEKRRDEAYKGSLDHFINSLVNKNLKKDGFEISLVNSLEPDRLRLPLWKKTLLDDRDSIKLLEFDQYLEVRYKELEESSYRNYIDKEFRHLVKSSYQRETTNTRPQTSILEINSPKGYAVIKDGKLDDPTSLIQHGYWGWKRTADILPLNYEPND
ncbi:carboxypeptidase-like regulatory domain-containing protein [Fulvivirga lutea]|uniref:Carboxypeptidase-like regulatory domain-containing protein n=1 Tax=Fulvivirga lutea TaxID=2810512 RepID=A0A974WI69_9BACT|nr:carboxypeptidase-like regulatory domain-containing protein [Fulvivirga lutea]QSE98881.1 carboxypeptidase-like regulatory domain-containing protein [Fulvivirga lutea]